MSASRGRYQIRVGHGLLDKLPQWLDAAPIALLFDMRLEKTAQNLAARLRASGRHCLPIGLIADESLKSLASVGRIYEELVAQGVDRGFTLLALGGGTLLDAVGFVAATYLRGLRWIAVPTTLLAQVDAAIGGKTALDLLAGKNLVGAIHPPSLVIGDTALLGTLPPREFISGLGEIVKYGVACDRTLYRLLEAASAQLLDRDATLLLSVVARCARIKARIVSADEFETLGGREILNFGHTIGHALEVATSYALRHGEAVIYGMRGAVALSQKKGLLDGKIARRIENFLQTLPVVRLPAKLRAIDVQARIGVDKKRRAGRQRWVLLRNLGHAVPGIEVEEAAVREVLERLLADELAACFTS